MFPEFHAVSSKLYVIVHDQAYINEVVRTKKCNAEKNISNFKILPGKKMCQNRVVESFMNQGHYHFCTVSLVFFLNLFLFVNINILFPIV